MTTFETLMLLLRAYGKVTGHYFFNLRFYDDFSGSILDYHGASVGDFDTLAEGKELLINLIIEAVK